MSAVFVKKYPCVNDFDKREICRYLKADKADESTLRLIDGCIKECGAVIDFAVCFTELPISVFDGTVKISDHTITSVDLSKNLKGCQSVLLFSATIGLGIDRLISKYNIISPAKAVIFQAVGAERAEHLCNMFNNEMRLEYEKNGYCLKPRFSSGYGDLSLEEQKYIFSVLGCQQRIGLNLGDNLLMSPSKSVTAFIGIYRK